MTRGSLIQLYKQLTIELYVSVWTCVSVYVYVMYMYVKVL